jgi:RecA-family ATPase
MDWIETESKEKFGLSLPSKQGEVNITCPVCSADRTKKNQKCLSINTAKGVGHCHHCNRSFVKPESKLNGKEYENNHLLIQPFKKTASISNRPFNDSEKTYWYQYGISAKILEFYKVSAVEYYQIGKHYETTDQDNPIFCYDAGGGSYKIYRPFAKDGQNKFSWVGGKPEGWYFGLGFCKGHVQVYIAAGEKDVLTLICQGVEAFTLNSETAEMPESLAKQLNSQYKKVIVLYDNDKTGIDNSLKICKEFGFTRAILPENIKDVSDLIKAGRSFDEIQYEAPPEDDFFLCKTANEWIMEAKQTQSQPQLFGPFITKGELTLIFSDPSAGKSVIIVQIGDNLCRGLQTMGLKNEAAQIRVIYFDFELSAKQFEKRNSDENGNLFHFHPNFYRAEINGMAAIDDEKLEVAIFNKIEKLTDRLKADFIIIDNISWLHSETEKSKFAVPLMRKLKGMVKDRGTTVIVINHTVKRNEAQAITANDMAGSKQLRALADMIWTIGRSATNKDIRYLKMLKDNRTTGEIYGSDNVLVCELIKSDHLHFDYLTEGREIDYLPRIEDKEHNAKDSNKMTAQVMKAKGLSNIEIGKLLNVTEGTIRQWLKS